MFYCLENQTVLKILWDKKNGGIHYSALDVYIIVCINEIISL